VSDKKKFLLRLDADLYEAIEKWAADDLRSTNAQIEFLLTEAVKRAKRAKEKGASPGSEK
jgi:hypothetical protein